MGSSWANGAFVEREADLIKQLDMARCYLFDADIH